jgi:hypothetical protein
VIILNRQFPRALIGGFLLIAEFIIGSAFFVQPVGAAPLGRQAEENVLLDLIGYNYTDRHINSYSIDGQGGGDVRLSSPTSGGGGIVCCVELRKRHSKPIIVRVRWQVDGCTYLVKSTITGRKREYTHHFYREAYVEVPRPERINPSHLESHFYPNGSVQVKLTEHMSLPRMSLNEKRPDQSQFPRCKDDKKPE